jgi:hypothetical protein
VDDRHTSAFHTKGGGDVGPTGIRPRARAASEWVSAEAITAFHGQIVLARARTDDRLHFGSSAQDFDVGNGVALGTGRSAFVPHSHSPNLEDLR